MNINEKLKNASLEAEKEAFLNLPDDENIAWTPSERFQSDIAKITVGRTKRFSLKRRILAISAAVLSVAAVAVSVPLMTNEPETSKPEISATYNNFYNNTVSEIEIVAQPEYIPKGYTVNSCTVWTDGSLQIEYINGENKIVFKSYPADEVDVSAFDEVIEKLDINGNDGFAANNFNGALNNNIAWNDGNFSYIITNDMGVELEELVKVALSVNSEK